VLLRHEDDLHLDLRTLSFRFMFAPKSPPKSAADLRQYATHGSGTVRGEQDAQIGRRSTSTRGSLKRALPTRGLANPPRSFARRSTRSMELWLRLPTSKVLA